MAGRISRRRAIVALGLAAWLAAGCNGPSATGANAADGTATKAAAHQEMLIGHGPFGATADGTPVELITFGNGRGMMAAVITYGATLIGVQAPDRMGGMANVVLNGGAVQQYEAGAPGGSVIGRYANRIGGAKFTLDGVEYPLAANSGKNHIHGGRVGFQKVVWQAESVRGDDFVGVRLTHISPDGDEGYPGTLKVAVTYTLTAANELKMEYVATTDKPTIVSLTNHAYWNLAGAGVGTVLEHRLTMNADRWLAVDDGLIPTGELKSVESTPLDFRRPQTIGARIDQLAATRGYDHCYVLNKKTPGELSLAARVVEPASGRVMEVWTTYPGVQLYTANHLNGRFKADDRPLDKHGALCLETQFFPDSPNKPGFPSTVLRPGQTYRQMTVHKFSAE